MPSISTSIRQPESLFRTHSSSNRAAFDNAYELSTRCTSRAGGERGNVRSAAFRNCGNYPRHAGLFWRGESLSAMAKQRLPPQIEKNGRGA
jgi:hypothetical protein